MDIYCKCPTCNEWVESVETCPKCSGPLLVFATEVFHETGKLDQCVVCGSQHLYRQKDFNRKVGVAIVVIGVLLAYWTYGLSLLAVAFIDWVIYQNVFDVGCCYRCGAQYREFEKIGELEPFNLQLHYYYKNLEKR